MIPLHDALSALPLGAWVVVTTPHGEAFRCQRVANGIYVEGDVTIAVEDVDPGATVGDDLAWADDPFDAEDYAAGECGADRWKIGPSAPVGPPDDEALLEGLAPRQRQDASRLLREDPGAAARRAVRAMKDCRRPGERPTRRGEEP